jgi:hypothetical protein
VPRNSAATRLDVFGIDAATPPGRHHGVGSAERSRRHPPFAAQSANAPAQPRHRGLATGADLTCGTTTDTSSLP